LDKSIGGEGVLRDGQAVVGKGEEIELDGFMCHLDRMFVVVAPGDAALEGGDGHGISPFGLGSEMDAVGQGLHTMGGFLLILRRPDEGSRETLFGH
jgi:hypothetical protein